MIDLIPGVMFSDTEKQLIGAFATTFLGAFFAFLLVVIRDRVKAISLRKKRHYNALVKLNRQISLHSSRIEENLFILPNLSQTLKKGHVYFNRLSTVPYETDFLMDLHNLKVEDALMLYFDTLSKDNDDINNFQVALDNLSEAYITGSLNEANYRRNAKYLAVKIDELYDRIKDDTLNINSQALATVNQLIKTDQTLGMKVDHYIVGQSKVDSKEIKRTSKIIYKERVERLESRLGKLLKEDS